jgi:YHS domain-containing protein
MPCRDRDRWQTSRRRVIVCNTPLTFEAETWVSHYHAHTFFFCSLACKEQFDLEPEDYYLAPRRSLSIAPGVLAMR